MGQRPPERRLFVLFAGYWLPALAYVTAIIVVAAQANLRPPVEFRNADKVLHAVEYFGLGLLLVRALRASLRVRVPLFSTLMAMAFGVLVGAADEYIQWTTPGREASLLDLAADAAGLALAQVVYLAVVRRRQVSP